MKNKDNQQQQELIRWFENTYQTRGYRYLRPVEAYAIFLTLLRAQAGEKLLDIACGGGLLLKQSLHKGLESYGVDISSKAIELAKDYVPGAVLKVGNAESLPFPDNYFDCITCLGSLERFIYRDKALLEIQRVSKNQARICIMVRNARSVSWLVYRRLLGFRNKKAHQDAKGMNEWKQLFETAGFNVLGIYHDHWPVQRLKKWFLSRKKVDFASVRKSWIPLGLSKEFIFILNKQ